jgi:hypothetical protein
MVPANIINFLSNEDTQELAPGCLHFEEDAVDFEVIRGALGCLAENAGVDMRKEKLGAGKLSRWNFHPVFFLRGVIWMFLSGFFLILPPGGSPYAGRLLLQPLLNLLGTNERSNPPPP